MNKLSEKEIEKIKTSFKEWIRIKFNDNGIEIVKAWIFGSRIESNLKIPSKNSDLDIAIKFWLPIEKWQEELKEQIKRDLGKEFELDIKEYCSSKSTPQVHNGLEKGSIQIFNRMV